MIENRTSNGMLVACIAWIILPAMTLNAMLPVPPNAPSPKQDKSKPEKRNPLAESAGGNRVVDDKVTWVVLEKFPAVSLSETLVRENWRWMPDREKALQTVDEGFAKIPKQGAHILVLPIDDKLTTQTGHIDSWQAEWIRKKIHDAKASDTPPDLVVLEMDTGGGGVLASIEINDILHDADMPTVAFVRGRAFSGGSIIATACQRVYMRDVASVGGAQILIGMKTPEGDLAEKLKSFLRAEFRTRAQKYGHPATVCQGMTDRDISVREIFLQDSDGVVRRLFASPNDMEILSRYNKIIEGMERMRWDSHTLINLDAKQALDTGFSAGTVDTIEEILRDKLGLIDFQIERKVPTRTELTQKWFSHPAVAGILLMLAFGFLVYEFRTPGIGIGLALAGIFGGIFIWVQFIAHSAGMLEMIMFVLGSILILLEVLVIPGFGAAGISGLVLMFLSVLLSFIPDNVQFTPFKSDSSPASVEIFDQSLRWAMMTMVMMASGVIVVIWQWRNLPFMKRLQHTAVESGTAHDSEMDQYEKLLGKVYTVIRDCRPAGQIDVDGIPMEAESDGAFIDRGKSVKVLKVIGGRVIVREVSGG